MGIAKLTIIGALFCLARGIYAEPQIGCSAYPGDDLLARKTRETCQLRDRICYLEQGKNPSVIMSRSMLGDLRKTCVSAKANQPVISFSLDNPAEQAVSIAPVGDNQDVQVTPHNPQARAELLACLNSLLSRKAKFLWTEIQDKPFLSDRDRLAFSIILQNNDFQKLEFCR